MKSKEFIAILSDRLGWNSSDVNAVLTDFAAIMGARLANDDSVSWPGFGQFEVKKKMERISVNPITKKRYLVPPKLVPVFKPSSSLKAKLKRLTDDE